MRILSNNLWNRDANSPAWAEKGEDCSADCRVNGLVRAYLTLMPDVLGFQEMSRHMEKRIMERMRRVTLSDGTTVKYEIVTGGFTPILFRHDKLRLLASGHRLYPKEFPPYAGTFNDSDSKGYTYGVFEERESGKKVAVITTHLWWKSADPKNGSYQEGSDFARAYQVGLASAEAKRLNAEYGCPVILMGDLNDRLGSPALNAALSDGWTETHALCTGERSDIAGYHYCFPDGWRQEEQKDYSRAIDHILIREPGNAEVTRFLRFTEEYFDCLSDHYPVYIDLNL